MIRIQSMLFTKNFGLRFALLFNALDAAFDDGRGSCYFCNVCDFANDRDCVFQQFKGCNQSRYSDSTECYSSYGKCRLYSCSFCRSFQRVASVAFQLVLVKSRLEASEAVTLKSTVTRLSFSIVLVVCILTEFRLTVFASTDAW